MTEIIADRRATLSSLTPQNLHRFSTYAKSDNCEWVFRHLPNNSPAKGTTKALEGPGMDVVKSICWPIAFHPRDL
jgi:hypothetical protein